MMTSSNPGTVDSSLNESRDSGYSFNMRGGDNGQFQSLNDDINVGPFGYAGNSSGQDLKNISLTLD